MRISVPGLPSFMGRRNLGNGHSVFSSRLMDEIPDSVSTFRNIVETFKDTYGLSFDDIEFSARIMFTLAGGELICYQWERQFISKLQKMQLDFMKAPKCFGILKENYNDLQIEGVEEITKAIEKLRSCPKTWGCKSWEYVPPTFLANVSPKKSSLPVKLCPADSVLSILSKELANSESNFEETWCNFKTYLKECVRHKKLLNEIPDCGMIETDSCLLYQKLQMLAFGISKLRMKNLKTENFVLTSDQINDIDDRIKSLTDVNDKNCEEMRGLRDKALKIKSKDPSITSDAFHEQLKVDRTLSDCLWRAIPASTFDYVQQCELALDYIDGLTPREVMSLLSLVLCYEILNETGKGLSGEKDSEFQSQIDAIATRLALLNPEMKEPEDLVIHLEVINKMTGLLQDKIARRWRLLECFPKCYRFIDKLLLTEYCCVENESERKGIDVYIREEGANRSEVQQTIQIILSANVRSGNTDIYERFYISTDRTSCLVASVITELLE